MGNVVPLAGQTKGSGRRRRRKASKTALVLGGGGMTGAVYEIGALRALDLLAVNRSVNDFDIYVGTSAGSFVGAMAANGITPEEMMRVVNQQVPAPFRDLDVGTVLRPDVLAWGKALAKLPFVAARTAREMLPQLGAVSIMDFALGMAEALPPGAYSGKGIERYVREVLSDPDRTDDFRNLDNELYLTATDLDTCERIVFGQEGWDDLPISLGVRASTALPMVYEPVPVRDRELVDGGIVSTTNVDVAVEAGAKFIVVVNPLVPYVNDFEQEIRTLGGTRPRRVSDMGLAQIGYQTFKMMAYQRLHGMAKQWETRYPGVDIVLVEPQPDDELMFQTQVMNFTKRVDIARHGFESVTLSLAGDYERIAEVAGRHGIELSATRVRKVVQHFVDERDDRTAAWRRVLEQTTGALLRQSAAERG